MIRASLFGRATDNRPEPVEYPTFDALAASLSQFKVVGTSQEDKRRCPCICPAEFFPEKTRAKENVRQVWFLMLDFDGLTQAQFDQIVEIVSPYRSILYTTHGHHEARKQGQWKFRLCVDISKPVLAEEWPRFWEAVREKFLWLCDDKCKDPSRMFFVPCVPTEAALADAVFEVADGGTLDVVLLLSMVAGSQSRPPSAKSRAIGTVDILGLAKRLASRKKSPALQKVSKVLALVAAGEPYAEKGERDDMMFQATQHIYEAWPDADPATVNALWKPSLDKMKAADPDSPGFDDLVVKADRAQRKAAEDAAKKKQEEDDAVRARIFQAFGGKRSEPYSEEELDAFAKDAGVSRADFRKRWVLENSGHHYLFFDGQYQSTPVLSQSLWLAAEKMLSPAIKAGIDLHVPTKDNEGIRRLTQDEIVERYGTHFREVEMDLRAQRARYDLERDVLVEAPCPLRPLIPEYSEPVEYWLTQLAGPDMLAKVLDWIATVTLLDEPNAALYLSGNSGAGKTLLADGLARLWTLNGPTEMDSIAGNFNEDAAHCPLIFADEKVPDELLKGDGTGWLRQLIQGRSMKLRRKYKPEATLHGAIRVIFAANNDTLLHTRALLTPDDAEAVAKRILHVPVDYLGREVLEFMREDSPDVLESFVRGDVIAKHALWLKQTRPINHGKRFMVEGGSSALERALLTSSDISASVIEWCLGYLTQPSKVDTRKTLLVRIDRGRLLVNVKALTQHWNDYIPERRDKVYSAQTLANALAAVSEKMPIRLSGADGHPVDYREVKLDVLHGWGHSKGFATHEQIDAALGKPTDWEGMPRLPEREPGQDDTPF